MAVTVYQHPDTKDIKQVDPGNSIQVAAVKKLGYVEMTEENVEEAGLGVEYHQVTSAKQPTTPPDLPHLSKAIPPGPTKDTSTAPPTEPIVTEDTGTDDDTTQPFTTSKK